MPPSRELDINEGPPRCITFFSTRSALPRKIAAGLTRDRPRSADILARPSNHHVNRAVSNDTRTPWDRLRIPLRFASMKATAEKQGIVVRSAPRPEQPPIVTPVLFAAHQVVQRSSIRDCLLQRCFALPSAAVPDA